MYEKEQVEGFLEAGVVAADQLRNETMIKRRTRVCSMKQRASFAPYTNFRRKRFQSSII